MSAPSTALFAIKAFVSALRISTNGINEGSDKHRETYRLFHAILIWDIILERPKHGKILNLYQKETLADLSTAYFLTLICVYKPARLSLRSAIENCVRVLLLHEGVDIEPIKSVHGLFDLANASASMSATQKFRISTLHGIYGELCKTVHSVAINYMSLEIPFQSISKYDTQRSNSNLKNLRDTLRLINSCFYRSFYREIDTLSPRNQDAVLDALPRAIKKEITELK